MRRPPYQKYLSCRTCGVGPGEQCLRMPPPTRPGAHRWPNKTAHRGRLTSKELCGRVWLLAYGQTGRCTLPPGHTAPHTDERGRVATR